MAQYVGRAARVMRHLVFANDELRRKGWRGVEALPAPVLRRALAQAQMLASDEAWPVLARIVERLHLMHVGAQLREQRKAKLRANGKTRVEVTELTHDELEETASAAGWEACHRPPYRRAASPVLVRPGECGRRHAPNRVPADRKPGGGTAAPAATKA